MTEPKGTILPVYFVGDESYSMSDQIQSLNDGLADLIDALHEDVITAAKVRLSVVGFSDDAVCYMEAADPGEVERFPQLEPRGRTSYAAAFNELYERIPQDVDRLKREGYLVYRPAVFFLSDGLPNKGDGWEDAHARLTDQGFPMHPNILAFGVGEADPAVLWNVATYNPANPEERYAYVAQKDISTGQALQKFAQALTQSIVHSARALAEGKTELVAEEPEGFDRINISIDTV